MNKQEKHKELPTYTFTKFEVELKPINDGLKTLTGGKYI